PPPPAPPCTLFGPDAPIERSQLLHTVYHKQQLERARVQQVQVVMHADAKTLKKALMNDLPKLYKGRLPEATSEFAGLEAEHKFVRSRRMGTRKQKKEFLHHLFLVATLSPDGSISVAFSTAPSSSSSPHAIEGLFVITPAAHGCCGFAMAVKMRTAGAEREDEGEKPGEAEEASETGRQETAIGRGVTRAAAALKRSENGLPLSPGEAGVLIDDLLSLAPTIFKLYDRSAEVDEAVQESLAEHFLRARTNPNEPENKMMDKSLEFMDKPWARKAGTIMEPVSIFECITKGSKSSTALGSSSSNSDGDNMSAVWGKAEADVDASTARVLAYLWNYMSYERCAEFNEKNAGMLRKELDVLDSHSKLVVAATKMPFSVTDRVSGAWWSWRRESDNR
ncbi:hypothetical protein TeGR_g2183, partial [Tetraparma gracilis]